jgi:hypothetical protein
MAKSHNKGSAFERDVSKLLSNWISNNQDAHIFCRRSGSGGAARDKKGLSGTGGDIYADKGIGEWLTNHTLFELKFYADLKGDLWNFMAGKNSKIDEFMFQAEESSEPYGRTWTLILKSNRMEILCITNSAAIGEFVESASLIRKKDGDLFLFPFVGFLEKPFLNLQSKIESSTVSKFNKQKK